MHPCGCLSKMFRVFGRTLVVERGGRGSRTLVLLTYYRNFVTCVGADQIAGRAFHHRILRKRGKREP